MKGKDELTKKKVAKPHKRKKKKKKWRMRKRNQNGIVLLIYPHNSSDVPKRGSGVPRRKHAARRTNTSTTPSSPSTSRGAGILCATPHAKRGTPSTCTSSRGSEPNPSMTRPGWRRCWPPRSGPEDARFQVVVGDAEDGSSPAGKEGGDVKRG